MKKAFTTLASIAIGFLPVALTMIQPTQAQPKGCTYLREVSTGQTSIEKTISAQGLGRNDWNTDFAIPPGSRFRYFMVHVYPQNTASYKVTVNFKYNDNTAAEVFQKDFPMQQYQLYSQTFQSPTGRQPYQINTNIGGDMNNVYSVAVLACQ